MNRLTLQDQNGLSMAYEEACLGLNEGGCPIGAALFQDGEMISSGRNRRVQMSDPIAHGEMDCIRRAGRLRSYQNLTLYTTLSPCMMCTGTLIQFKIPRVVIGDSVNFAGNIDLLNQFGIETLIVNDPRCISLMSKFIEDHPTLWAEDIAEPR